MKKTQKYILAIGLTLGSLMISGCNSGDRHTPEYSPMPVATCKQVDLGNIPFGLTREFSKDESDVRKVVEVALASSDMGDHKLAAKMFMQASKDFSSNDKRLERALISAGICEYFQAGMINEVRESLKALDSYRTTVYRDFDDEQTIAKIRKIVK